MIRRKGVYGPVPGDDHGFPQCHRPSWPGRDNRSNFVGADILQAATRFAKCGRFRPGEGVESHL